MSGMMRFYRLRAPSGSSYTGDLDAWHKWGGLPGVRCPECKATWAGGKAAYPSVELSGLAEREAFIMPRPEPLEEFLRLKALVRPFVPPGAHLLPGTEFGLLEGTATGEFGSFVLHFIGMKLMRREALEALQAEGVRGLKGVRPQLRFEQAHPPELVELELLPHGRLHPDCTHGRPAPCAACGRHPYPFPDEPILDGASLPTDTDLFLLADFETILIASGRLVEAVRRLGLDDVDIQEVPVR